MTNFLSLVRNILNEADASTPDVASTANTPNVPNDENEESQSAESLSGFLDSKYGALQSLWKTYFASQNFVMCSPSELKNLSYTVTSFKSRSTKTPDAFPDIESTFPLIDLAAMLYENVFKGKKRVEPNKADSTFNEFETRLTFQHKQNSNMKPLDYDPADTWARTVKSAYLSQSKNELGKLRLNEQPKEASIYQIILNLLTIRKNILLPKIAKLNKNVNAEPFIRDIMLKPWNLVTGKYAINDKRVSSLYDGVTVQQLVNVSLACYRLYLQQASLFVDEKNLNEKIKKNETKYNDFMTGTVQWSVQESLNPSFNTLVNFLLKEMVHPDIISSALADVESKKAADKEANKPKMFETGPNTNTFEYNFNNLQIASKQARLDEATNLIEQLENLANYIKTKEGRDILGGMAQIAKGLMFGVAPSR